MRRDGIGKKWSNFRRIGQEFLRDQVKVVREKKRLSIKVFSYILAISEWSFMNWSGEKCKTSWFGERPGAAGYVGLDRAVWVGDKNLDDSSTEMLFKAAHLDSIICEVSADRKKRESKGWVLGYSNIEKTRQWGEIGEGNDWEGAFIKVGGKPASMVPWEPRREESHREGREQLCPVPLRFEVRWRLRKPLDLATCKSRVTLASTVSGEYWW